jgi:hypothetical protein
MLENRNQVWIDQFQTKLFIRIGLYLFGFLVGHANLLFIWRLLQEGPGNPLQQYWDNLVAYGPTFLCLIILMPIMAWDAIRFSHRLVGPIVRFRKMMQQIADGEPVHPVKLREDDFLIDLRDDFNKMLEALQRQGVHAIKPLIIEDEQSEQRKTA